jgi:hypothetical protein
VVEHLASVCEAWVQSIVCAHTFQYQVQKRDLLFLLADKFFFEASTFVYHSFHGYALYCFVTPVFYLACALLHFKVGCRPYLNLTPDHKAHSHDLKHIHTIARIF